MHTYSHCVFNCSSFWLDSLLIQNDFIKNNNFSRIFCTHTAHPFRASSKKWDNAYETWKVYGAFCFPTHRPNALHYNTFSKVYVKSVCIDFLFLMNLRLRSVCNYTNRRISKWYNYLWWSIFKLWKKNIICVLY